MANMHPANLYEYNPTTSEQLVFYALKESLPDTYDVFYSVRWSRLENEELKKSETDFLITNPNYGFLCLECKGGNIRIEEGNWYIETAKYGERILSRSPFEQAEDSMYYFLNAFRNKYYIKYPGIYAAGVILPYAIVGENITLDNRSRMLTIDKNDLAHIETKIKDIFKVYAGKRFGLHSFDIEYHRDFLEMINENIAIAATAGALIRSKEKALEVINRVQDNFISFISNIRQFYIKGGAGTGKTWIAMKLATLESHNKKRTLFLCSSVTLAKWVRNMLSEDVDVYDVKSLFMKCIKNFDKYSGHKWHGLSEGFDDLFPKYDAIFIDEAQDFSEEWAQIVKKLLSDSKVSRMGVFYDEVQILKRDCFCDGFGIDSPPYLLTENIRNTASIYKWTAERTNLGLDVISNPIEGAKPYTASVRNPGELTIKLEETFNRFIRDEGVNYSSIVIISDFPEVFLEQYINGIACWKFVAGVEVDSERIRVVSIPDFKGLEADMVVYIHGKNSTANENYIAYTRAKYYLIEYVEEYK